MTDCDFFPDGTKFRLVAVLDGQMNWAFRTQRD